MSGCISVVGAGTREVDTTFSLSLRRLAADDDADDSASEAAVDDDDYVAQAASTDVQAGRLGLKFRCGMTFCEAGEALESVGRCVDWGAHVCPTDLLLSELAADGERTVAVKIYTNAQARNIYKAVTDIYGHDSDEVKNDFQL